MPKLGTTLNYFSRSEGRRPDLWSSALAKPVYKIVGLRSKVPQAKPHKSYETLPILRVDIFKNNEDTGDIKAFVTARFQPDLIGKLPVMTFFSHAIFVGRAAHVIETIVYNFHDIKVPAIEFRNILSSFSLEQSRGKFLICGGTRALI